MIQNLLMWFIPGLIVAIIVLIIELYDRPLFFDKTDKLKMVVRFILFTLSGPVSVVAVGLYSIYYLTEWLMD